MLKIQNYKDYEKQKEAIPTKISNSIAGDLYLFGTELSAEYYNKDDIDKYGPQVLVVTKEEFENIENLIPTISKNDYEYKDLVGYDKDYYYEKYCYLFNNGESGIYVYVMRPFLNIKNTFIERMYITATAKEQLSDVLIAKLVVILEAARMRLKGNLDYLQVFEITRMGIDTIRVNHRQEEPDYNETYRFKDTDTPECKLFWISSEDENGEEYSTLMLAEDY